MLHKKSARGYCFIVVVIALFAFIVCGCGKSNSDKMDEAVEQVRQAQILYNQQEYLKALSAINTAILINSELKRDSALGESYLLLALCHRKVGQYDSSISAFKISLEYFHLVGDQRLERRGRIELAELFYSLGRFKDALSLASDAAGEARVFSDAANLTHALLLVAKASRRLQDFSRDASALDEVSRIEDRDISGADLMKLKFLSAAAAGDGDRVHEAYEQWKSFVNAKGDSAGLAETYSAWGAYQFSLHHPDSALKAYSQALNMIGGLSSRKLQTEVLTALGIIAYRGAHYDNARLYFQEAQSLSRQDNNIINDQLLTLIIVANDWKSGRTSQSSELVRRSSAAGTASRQCGFRMGDIFAQYLKGTIELRSGDTSAARTSFSEAFRFDEQNIMPNLEAYPVFDVVDAFLDGERSTWVDPLLQLYSAAAEYGDLFRLAEQVNTREMQSFFSQSTLSTNDVHINHAADELHLKRNALRLLEDDIYEELSSGKGRNIERINLLNRLYPERLQELVNAAQSLEGTNIQWLVNPKPITLNALRDTLPRNSVLVEFISLPHELHLLAVTKDSVYVRSSSITRQRLLALIDEYNRLIGDSRLNTHAPNFNGAAAVARIQELSSILYNILIEPIYSLTSTSSKMYVVLPQNFGWLPVHTLRSGNGTPSIVKVPVSYLPSAAALFFQSRQEKFVSDVVCLGHAGKTNWDVEYELKDIRSFYDKTRMFFDTAATLGHLKTLACDVVHIAAEFVVDTRVPENSAIVLSDGATPYGLRPVPLGDMLTFSYPPTLVFSNISPATGGLSRYAPMLFLAGGSRTVITTMWQGERKAKKYFGEVFYTNLMSGIPASTAYHQAMIAMVNNPEISRLHRWGLYFQFGR